MGNLTSSLVYDREHALAHFRVRHLDSPGALFLFTDGYLFSGEMPYPLAALLQDPEALDRQFPQVILQGDRGDDVTCAAALDPDVLVSPAFQEGLSRLAAQGEAEEEAAQLRKELARLRCYLDLAARKLRAMESRQDPGLQDLRLIVRPKAIRYRALLEAFQQKGGTL